MTLEVSGKVQVIYDVVQVSEKFKKREFVLELTEEINGNLYTNYAKFQTCQGKCDILDRFKATDMVKVSFNIKGNAYVDKKDGVTKYITNLDAWRIEGVQQQYQAYNGNGSAPATAQPPAGNSYNATPAFNPAPETIDDLPF